MKVYLLYCRKEHMLSRDALDRWRKLARKDVEREEYRQLICRKQENKMKIQKIDFNKVKDSYLNIHSFSIFLFICITIILFFDIFPFRYIFFAAFFHHTNAICHRYSFDRILHLSFDNKIRIMISKRTPYISLVIEIEKYELK